MPNPHRGDVSVILDGERRTLRLTLGALAELEAALEAPDLVALAGRFESGVLKTNEAIAIIGAGLRGAGHPCTDEDVARMTPEGGIAGTIRASAALLSEAFAA